MRSFVQPNARTVGPQRAFAAAPQRRALTLARPTSHVARVTDVAEATFEQEVLKAGTPVLVDFWAAWCGPCKLMSPLMDWAEQEYPGKLKVVKIEHDSNPKLIAQYKVYGLPTLILFKDGQEVSGSKREGAITKALLQAYLTKQGIAK